MKLRETLSLAEMENEYSGRSNLHGSAVYTLLNVDRGVPSL